ncbi:MAG: hypothetical protein HYY79_08855 [Betaproteobacteria bacterium]|nr:hypothetical protein [Betaproteobacteria bacterium]
MGQAMRRYGVSECRACCILGQPRGTQRYRPILRLDDGSCIRPAGASRPTVQKEEE